MSLGMANSSKTFVTLLDTIKEIYNRDTDLSIHPKKLSLSPCIAYYDINKHR
jgi:hypothetical protein